VLKQMYTKAYEGHIANTWPKTTDVPAAAGHVLKEFPAQFDWQHNGEGLTVFNLMPLGIPIAASIASGSGAFPASTWMKTPARPTTILSSG